MVLWAGGGRSYAEEAEIAKGEKMDGWLKMGKV
jgi:hypothetical protein